MRQLFWLETKHKDVRRCIVHGARIKKVFGSAEGRHIDFLDIGLSLAFEVLFPLSSDYLCAVWAGLFNLICKDKIMVRNHLLL